MVGLALSLSALRQLINPRKSPILDILFKLFIPIKLNSDFIYVICIYFFHTSAKLPIKTPLVTKLQLLCLFSNYFQLFFAYTKIIIYFCRSIYLTNVVSTAKCPAWDNTLLTVGFNLLSSLLFICFHFLFRS